MDLFSRRATRAVLGFLAITASVTSASAMFSPYAGAGAVSPLDAFGTTQSAEICTSLTNRQQVVRGFNPGESFFVEVRDPSAAQPDVKEGYTFKRDPSGVTKRNEVSFDMFELMAEPFGGTPRVRTEWKATYEEIFDGKVTVYDDKGKAVGTYVMSCNAAIVQYL